MLVRRKEERAGCGGRRGVGWWRHREGLAMPPSGAGAETQGRRQDPPGGQRKRKREPRGLWAAQGGAAVAWTTGNWPRGLPPLAPLSRWGGQAQRGRLAEPVSQGAWPGGQPRARPSVSLRGSRGQHPNTSILGRRLWAYTSFGSIPLLINPFWRPKRGCHWWSLRIIPWPGKGWEVSLHWPPICTPHCLEPRS